jgi:hypothetical protein
MFVAPVNTLAAESVTVPLPAFVSVPEPAPMSGAAIVRFVPVAALTINSLAAPAPTMPVPVML